MNRLQRIILALGLAGFAAFLGAQLALRLKPSAQKPAFTRVAAGEAGGSAASAPAPLDAHDEPVPGLQSATIIPPRLPEFSLHNLQGQEIGVNRWKDRSLMLNFWATWCAPCREEIPLLQAIHTEQAARGSVGTEVVGIAVDYPSKVADFAHRFGVTYPLLVGEQDALEVAARLGVSTPAFPFTVFSDRRGAIVALYMGALKRPDIDQILQIVDRLNQDQLDLPAAQKQVAARLAANREK